jgi:signal transduction histidine kinase
MSFRLRLILAFAGLALVQALLFVVLSDQLLRDGLEGEAHARLAQVASLLPLDAPEHDWPLAPPSAKDSQAWRHALQDYAKRFELSRATLLLGAATLDSQGRDSGPAGAWWASDGVLKPRASGLVKVSGPLFKAEDGWRKVLYAKLDPAEDVWLRVEAGTPFLGQVAALQKRLWRLSALLALPALLAGLVLGWALSRRARELAARLESPSQSVVLGGRDEFAAISSKIQALVDQREQLAAAKLRQAQDLALGVAHELRNPLAGLSLTTDLMERKRMAGAPAAELAELAGRLQAEVLRLENTVARFLDFARTPRLEMRRLDLAEAARRAAQGRVPAVGVQGEAGAQADPQALAVILGVLLSNAEESAGAQGSVTVAAEGSRLRVWDSGPAVAAEDRSRLFTPFFTRKLKGLGLGLATAASLADAMGGALRLRDDGKTFELELKG